MWSEPEPAPFRVPANASRTGSSWAIAAMPAVVFAVWLAALASPAGLSWGFVVAVIVLTAVLDVLLAMLDVRALSRAGYDRTASPYLAAVPVLYLFPRGHLCAVRNFEGYGPAWLHVAVVSTLLLVVAMWVLLSGAGSLFALFGDLIGSRVTP